MPEAVTLAIIGVAGTVIAAAFGFISAQLVRLNTRIRKLERRDRLSWLYIRKLIDHAYRHAPDVPLPEPPDGWLEEDEG